ncbi:Phosphoglucomutase/phosphomannomutase [Candidatus Anstonella stagnisolia]|nr:Phosphoglucomutase/phosphomannomutase [Candidatus Anstonella stagnisolia]
MDSPSFGTNGIRGRINELTPSAALEFSAAFAQWSGGVGKTIILGRDMRLTSPMLFAAAKAGALRSGANVLDIGLASSPTCEYILHSKKADGLIIVTASHNPPEWNALKFVDKNGVGISRERGKGIEKIAAAGAKPVEWKKIGKCIEYPDACKGHTNAMLKLLNVPAIKSRSLSVVLDCGNGTAATVAPQLFKALGCNVALLNEKIDGTFPSRPSEPTEANLQNLISKVKETHADLGIGWDGDSDRVIFIDEKARWIVGDKGFAISAALALQKKKGSIVTTVATSKVIEDVCKKYNGTLHYTKVGAPYISEKMHELGGACVSGGEEVGGIVWPELSLAKDGFFAAAKLAEAICEKKMPLSKMLDELPIYFNAKTKIECSASQKENTMKKLADYAKKSGLNALLLDGVRINFPDSWAIVRASGTENYFRVFAEAKSEKKAKALMEEYSSLVQKLMVS